MIEYVLCYVPRLPNHVLLIEKQKPEWQKGMFNLPGGKLESGESPIDAAVRELKEETGLDCESSTLMGQLSGDDYRVHVVQCIAWRGTEPKQMEMEQLFTLNVWVALTHPKLIPNLKIVIPLCSQNVKGWDIKDTDPAVSQTFKVRFS